MGNSLHRVPGEEPGGVSFTGDSGETDEGGLWKRSISLYGWSVRGTWRGAPLLGTLKDM